MATSDQLANTTTAGSAELALRKHGLTSTELLKLAHAAAAAGLDRMKPPPPLDTHEREDLVASLLEYGLRWAVAYDPNLDQQRNFATSVYSRMRLRVTDWCRTNIHDARFGTDKRHIAIDTTSWAEGAPSRRIDNDHDQDDAHRPRSIVSGNHLASPTIPWSDSTHDAFVEPDFQDLTVSRMRIDSYQRAATRAGVPLNQWITDALDHAALEDAA